MRRRISDDTEENLIKSPFCIAAQFSGNSWFQSLPPGPNHIFRSFVWKWILPGTATSSHNKFANAFSQYACATYYCAKYVRFALFRSPFVFARSFSIISLVFGDFVVIVCFFFRVGERTLATSYYHFETAHFIRPYRPLFLDVWGVGVGGRYFIPRPFFHPSVFSGGPSKVCVAKALRQNRAVNKVNRQNRA